MNSRSDNPGLAAELDAATQLLKQGRFDAAAERCRGILADQPENIRALNILGASLAQTGRIPQALQVAQKLCSLSPGNAVFLGNLSNLHGMAGQVFEATVAMAGAVLSDATNTTWQGRFARMIEHLEFYQATADIEVIRNAMQVCMANPAIDAATFSTAWHSLLSLDPVFAWLTALVQDGDSRSRAQDFEISELEALFADPFLLSGLRSLHATNSDFERVMTFLRYLLACRFADLDADAVLPFLCAMAEHCNLNEYVYGCTEEELAMVDALQDRLDLSGGIDAKSMALIALVSCYRDPSGIDGLDAVAQAGSPHADFARFIRHTFLVPAQIRGCVDTIPAGPSAGEGETNAVSASVAQQYEESPYPRWRHLDLPRLSEEQQARGQGKAILIAGCGTGQELLNMAAHYPEAQVLGIDLSAPSLAYGKHQAAEFGIGNVEFMRADILDIGELGRQFDLITCSGVLHHMEDPVAGWRRLLGCLKPDGFMKVALYSEAARQTVVLCREWIDEQGFAATPEGIRAFRQAVMAMDDGNPIRDVMNWTDFYSMSMCRDLVFHVREHRVTLPWIGSVLDELGLSCQSMRISNPAHRKEYLSMFPGDKALRNLDALHEYEKYNPATFRDMYSFWCCRKAAATPAGRPGWFITTVAGS